MPASIHIRGRGERAHGTIHGEGVRQPGWWRMEPIGPAARIVVEDNPIPLEAISVLLRLNGAH